MAGRRKLLKLIGPTAWVPDDHPWRGQISRTLLRGHRELVIDLEEAGWEYSVHLKREDGELFRGSWTCQDGNRTDSGSATARLYTSDNGYLLFGDWVQGGDRSHWWAELTSVEHFPDEVRE